MAVCNPKDSRVDVDFSTGEKRRREERTGGREEEERRGGKRSLVKFHLQEKIKAY